MLVLSLKLCIAALVLLMAIRAFQSGTTLDRWLGAYLLIGLVLLSLSPTSVAVLWLIVGAGGYLLSQILTSARLVSRGLPILAGVLLGFLYFL